MPTRLGSTQCGRLTKRESARMCQGAIGRGKIRQPQKMRLTAVPSYAPACHIERDSGSAVGQQGRQASANGLIVGARLYIRGAPLHLLVQSPASADVVHLVLLVTLLDVALIWSAEFADIFNSRTHHRDARRQSAENVQQHPSGMTMAHPRVRNDVLLYPAQSEEQRPQLSR